MQKRITAFVAAFFLSLATAVVADTSPAFAATTYHYAIGEQKNILADGAAVNLTVEAPHVNATHDGSGSQSLAELAVRSANGQNVIEVGWRKTATAAPVLFTYHWVAGVGQGYNLCTDYAANSVNSGSPIPTAWVGDSVSPARFQILHSGTNWWVAMSRTISGVTEGGWVCSLADSLWTSQGQTFNKVEMVQAYAEVASTVSTTPCSDMGDVVDAATPSRIGSYNLQGQTVGSVPSFTLKTLPSTVGIQVTNLSGAGNPVTTFSYGWAGYKDNPSPTADSLPGIAGC